MANSSPDIPRDPAPRSSSFFAAAIDKLVAICRVLPYGLVALGLRFLIARVFFLSGQAKIAGPTILISLFNRSGDFPIVLPTEIKPSTFELFQDAVRRSADTADNCRLSFHLCRIRAANLPDARLRDAAVGAGAPDHDRAGPGLCRARGAVDSSHVYLFAILMVPMSVGPGAISLDADPHPLSEIAATRRCETPLKWGPLWRRCDELARISASAPPSIVP